MNTVKLSLFTITNTVPVLK